MEVPGLSTADAGNRRTILEVHHHDSYSTRCTVRLSSGDGTRFASHEGFGDVRAEPAWKALVVDRFLSPASDCWVYRPTVRRRLPTWRAAGALMSRARASWPLVLPASISRSPSSGATRPLQAHADHQGKRRASYRHLPLECSAAPA